MDDARCKEHARPNMKHGAESKGDKRGTRVNGKDVKREGEERVLPAHARRANAMKCVSV